MHKKGEGNLIYIWLPLILLVLAAITLSLYNSFIREDRQDVAGKNAVDALSLINQAEYQLIYLDNLVRYSTDEALEDVSSRWFDNCNKISEYSILNQDPCKFDESLLKKSFEDLFLLHLSSHFEKSLFPFKNKYNLENVYGKKLVVAGKAFYDIPLKEGKVTYYIHPHFSEEINLDFSVFSSIYNEAVSKTSCLKQTSFNELTDSEDKLVKACKFNEKYEWKVKKKDNYALFDVKLPYEDLYSRFAISLNTILNV